MARRFVSADTLTCAIGAAPVGRAGTTIILVRPYDSVFDILASNSDYVTTRNGTTAVASLFLDGGKIFANNDFGAGANGPTDKNGWYAIAVTKASGSAAFRYHIAPLGGSWVHTGSGTTSDGTGATNILFGKGPIKGAGNFDIAAAAMYSAALSDGQIEALGTTSMNGWMAASPVTAWQFNQASTATAVTDLTSGGANQTAISGTAVVADPVGWSYASSGWTKDVVETYRVLNSWSKDVVERYRVTNAWSKDVVERYRVMNGWSKDVAETYRVYRQWTKDVVETYNVQSGTAWAIDIPERYRIYNSWSRDVAERYRVFAPWAINVTERYSILGGTAWAFSVQERYRIFNGWSVDVLERYSILSDTMPIPDVTVYLGSIRATASIPGPVMATALIKPITATTWLD